MNETRTIEGRANRPRNRLRRFRGDVDAVSSWLVIVVILVVVVVIAVAFLAAAEPPPTMNEPTEKTTHILKISFNFKYRNLPGGWIAPEGDREFKVSWEDYDKNKDYNKDDSFSLDTALLAEDEHRFTLRLEVSNAQGFLVREEWRQDVHIGEGSKIDVDFGTKYCYLEVGGSYTVKARLHVYAPKEGVLTGPIPWITDRRVDDEIWSLAKNVKVG